MADDIIKELWKIKDAIAQEHDGKIDSLVARLRKMNPPKRQRLVDLENETVGAREGAAGPAVPQKVVDEAITLD